MRQLVLELVYYLAQSQQLGLSFFVFLPYRHPNGFFRQLRRATLGSAASFGFFMGIGSLIRCDGGASRRRH